MIASSAPVKIIGVYFTKKKGHRVMWGDDQHWIDDLSNGGVYET